MINALFLSGAVIAIAAQAIIKKFYNGKTGNRGVLIFGAVSVMSACLFFILSSGFSFNFNADVLPYSAGFAVFYGMAIVTSFLSIQWGSLSLTSLITSYSLIIPTFYGLIFLGEDAGVFFWIGLVFLLVSLFLINSKKTEVKITLRWVIAVALAFLSNGICSVVQNAQQRSFAGEYKSELMIMALAAVGILLLATALVAERGEVCTCFKKGGYLMSACGFANGAANLFVMLLATRMNASLMFPIICAGGIILTWVLSRFLYKEKLSLSQNIALVLGILAVVFMNL